MVSQQNISSSTPMGATLVAGGGATFRVWAPRAVQVYINGVFGGIPYSGQSDDLLLAKDAHGYWTGFVAEAADGDSYHFWVNGTGSQGSKRDPYARELSESTPLPGCCCISRSADAYTWHDSGFVTPDFANMIIYQLHVGAFAIETPGVASTFLDVIAKIPYLTALGINVLQPLPVDEAESDPSMGYNGADYFSPDFPYVVTDTQALAAHLQTINNLLAQKSMPPLALTDIQSGPAQLKAMVDLCHVYGIAVAFDVVYNHGGGFTVNGKLDDPSLYYMDRVPNVGNNNDSLYFTDQDRGTGGLSFALWNNDVRQFLINNASFYIQEFHADGFRYDEISDLLSMNCDSGWSFCQDLTSTVRYLQPRLLQNAEFWPWEAGNYPKPRQSIITPVGQGGAGFDVLQHEGLRTAIRDAIESASYGQMASPSLTSIASNLYPAGFAHAWQTVTCVENHDVVKVGADPRVPALADSSNTRSWYATSRSRFATGILLTAPGIPQLFMGQEFWEDQQWSWDATARNPMAWDALNSGSDPKMVNHLRFMQDLIRLRWNQPALRGDQVNAFHVNDANRVIAFHRWLNSGQDVIVAATLAETTWYNYGIGFPYAGHWMEIFNSDVYENWVNPAVAGNGGGIFADGPPMHGFNASANVVIPANGFVVFAQG